MIISSYPIYHLESNATFLYIVSSIAVGPKCSYNFVPPMNSSISNQTFNEIHKRQVLITNLQYSKDFNLILNRFNLIRFNCFKKEIIRVINNEESRVETGTQTDGFTDGDQCSEADAEDSDETSKETVVTKTQEPTGPTQNITLNIVNFDMFSLLYIFHIL